MLDRYFMISSAYRSLQHTECGNDASAAQILYITARPKGAKLETTKPNTIVITPWKLETADTTLLDLMPFLESIVRLNVKDVREVLDSYMKEQEATGKDIPTIFRERQVAFQRMKAERTQAQPRMSRGYSFGRS